MQDIKQRFPDFEFIAIPDIEDRFVTGFNKKTQKIVIVDTLNYDIALIPLRVSAKSWPYVAKGIILNFLSYLNNNCVICLREYIYNCLQDQYEESNSVTLPVGEDDFLYCEYEFKTQKENTMKQAQQNKTIEFKIKFNCEEVDEIHPSDQGDLSSQDIKRIFNIILLKSFQYGRRHLMTSWARVGYIPSLGKNASFILTGFTAAGKESWMTVKLMTHDVILTILTHPDTPTIEGQTSFTHADFAIKFAKELYDKNPRKYEYLLSALSFCDEKILDDLVSGKFYGQVMFNYETYHLAVVGNNIILVAQ